MVGGLIGSGVLRRVVPSEHAITLQRPLADGSCGVASQQIAGVQIASAHGLLDRVERRIEVAKEP